MPINIILDSGAFSAWRLGKEINLVEYCDYLLANQDWITNYVALDVINPGEPEAAAAASFKNLKYMRKRGLKPIPVYHVGEDTSWLFRMLDLGCDYIGLSASSLVVRNRVDDWYAWAWSHLVTSKGDPIVKAHAFGEGRAQSMKQFPWASADSTSWLYAAQRTGTATLPEGQSISMRHDLGGSKASPDLNDLSIIDRGIFNDLMAECGIDPAAFDNRDVTSTILRTYLTAVFYQKTQASVRKILPIKFYRRGFLHNAYPKTDDVDVSPFNLHLVCGNNWVAWTVLTKLGFMNSLASYYYIAGPKRAMYSDLKSYVADPIKYITSHPKCAPYWNILEKYITC